MLFNLHSRHMGGGGNRKKENKKRLVLKEKPFVSVSHQHIIGENLYHN